MCVCVCVCVCVYSSNEIVDYRRSWTRYVKNES